MDVAPAEPDGSSAPSVRIDALREPDIEAVRSIEKRSFPTPWHESAYHAELGNRLAHYVVARASCGVVGYAGAQVIMDEVHITTIAVAPEWRRHRIGTRMLIELLAIAIRAGACRATLEVRDRNAGARLLYESLGFAAVGVRKRYYTDTDEDGIIMWAEDIPSIVARAAERLRDASIPPEGLCVAHSWH